MSTLDPSAPMVPGGGPPPVEHRFLGLDRRTFALPLIVVGIAVLWMVVSPVINESVSYDDPVRAGDVLIIGSTATMAPPVGWGVLGGVRVSDQVRAPAFDSTRTALSGDGVTVSTQAGPFSGDARALVAQVAENDEKLDADSALTAKGQPRTITVDGRHGVAQEFKTLTGEGAVFGFVNDGVGTTVIISGPTANLSHNADKLGQMLASIDFDVQGIS